MPEKIKTLYSNLIQEGYDLPNYDQFLLDMSDSNKRKKFHSSLIEEGYDLPDFNTFTIDMGIGEKKKPTSVGLPRAFQPFQEGVGQSVKMPSPSTSTSTSTKTPTTTTPKAEKPIKLQQRPQTGIPDFVPPQEIVKQLTERGQAPYDGVKERNRLQNGSQGLQKAQANAAKQLQQRDELLAQIDETKLLLEQYKGNPEAYNQLVPKYNDLIKQVKEVSDSFKTELQKIDIYEKGITATQLKMQMNEDSGDLRWQSGVNSFKQMALLTLPTTMRYAGYFAARSRGIPADMAYKVAKDFTEQNFGGLIDTARELAAENEELQELFSKETAWEAVKSGDVSKTADLATKELMGTLPATLGLMATYVNPFLGATTTIMGTAGVELEELDGEDMSPDGKMANALVKGGLEYATEKIFGTIPMVKRAIGSKNEAGKEMLENFVSKTWNKYAKKMGFPADVIEEVGSEMINTIGGNYTDYLTGKTDDLQLLKNIGQTFTTSLSMAALLSGGGRAVKYSSKKIDELRENTKQLKEISERQETTPEVLEVIQENIVSNNEKIGEESEKEKQIFDSMTEDEWDEATSLIQENQTLKEQIEAGEVQPEVLPIIEKKIEDNTAVIEDIKKEVVATLDERQQARISALERLKVAEQEITPQEPKIQEDEKITAKEENVEPMLAQPRNDRDEVKVGEASAELYSDQEGETQEVTPPTKENLKGENVETQSQEGVEAVKSPVFDDKNLTNEEEVKPTETKEEVAPQEQNKPKKVLKYDKEELEDFAANSKFKTNKSNTHTYFNIDDNSQIRITKNNKTGAGKAYQVTLHYKEDDGFFGSSYAINVRASSLKEAKIEAAKIYFNEIRKETSETLDMGETPQVEVQKPISEKTISEINEADTPKKTYTEKELKDNGLEVIKELKGKGAGGALSLGQQQTLESELGSLEGLSFFALDNGNVAVVKSKELLTNKPQEDAIKSGKIEQSSESERKGVTEQKQGEQEDRVNQEEPITKGQASPSGSDFVSEGGKGKEVKAKTTIELLKESVKNKAKKVKVVFKPAYDEKEHGNLSEKLKESLKANKVSEFDIISESESILSLVGNKDVLSIEYISEPIQKDKKKDIIERLENLKADTKGKMNAFGIVPAVWNAAIDTIILGVKAGRVISEVVQEAIDYINDNHGKFDEKAFKDMLVEGGVVTEDELVVEGEPTDEAEGEPKKDTERKPKQGSTPNSRVRSHYTTVTDNKTLSNITDELDSLEYEYEVKPEKSDKEKAIAYIEKYGVEESYQNVIDNTYNEELAGSEANALASLVYGALSKAMALAIKEGDMAAADLIKERSKELIKKISERGTDAGRFVNSFKYFAFDFSNPETAAYNLQKEVEEINKKTREKSSNISNANSVAKDIAKEVKKGKAKVVSEVVKDIDEMLYGTITKGKKGLTPEQKAKVKSVFEAFKVNKDGKVQSSVVPIKEIIAAIVTPEKYNQFIDKVADAVAEGVSLSVAMTRVSAEFIKNNIATPKEMAAARKALTEQVNGIKTKKPLTEKQIERRKASEELKAATEKFNLEKQLEKEKKKAEDLRQKDAEKVLKEVEKLELQRTRQNIKDLEKAIKDLQNQVKTDEELVNEIITEYLSLEGDAKTKNEKLVNLVKDNIEGLTDSEARVIATKIAKGVAEKIKKKLETKFGSALSKEEQEQKKVSATPKTKEDILDQLVKASNLGVASPQLIMDFFQNKYGIQNLSAEDVNGIIELSKALANAPTKNRKGVILAEIQKVIDSKKKRTLAELLQNLWYARVLSPVLTGVLGTGDVNLAYNILAVKLNMIEAPLTASINSMKYAVKDAKDNLGDLKKVGESIKQNLLGLLTDSLSASLAPFVQRVNYDADANLFKTIIKNPTLLRESITYFTESLSNGLAFKKDTENPFTATGASTFNISNYFKYFEDARKGDKKAKAIIARFINGYVNSVTNMLGGQDLAFGTMVGRGYMSTLVREKLYKEGLRGKELNSKVLETILDTKIQGELAAEKALSNRMNFDISIDLQMDNDGNTYYIIKDKGKVYKERQGIRLVEKRFDSKDEAIDYAREVVAPKSNTFRLDVINILNERLGEDVLKNMNRISSNDLLSAQAEGSARLVFSMATFIIDNLNKLSDAFNDMSKNLDTYDWKDILGMAKEKDIDAVKGIIRKVLKYITKTISILVRSTANLLAFMRVGLNSVRNQSSYIFPIGVLRYFASYFTDDKGKTRSLLSTMSYEMSDTEKSKILAKAMIGAYTFSATAYLSTFLTANADDDDEDKETLEERERARELFRSWYKEKTKEDLPRNIDDFYFKLTKGDVIGSLNWLTPEEYKFYKKTGLFPENSIFLGFDSKGKPIFESILNDPSYAMAVSASTYKLIQAFGDEEQKEMAKINAAITPFYSWKDMTIGQGGISVLLGNKKPQEKMETIVQVSVLDNLEVLSPRIIPVTLQYFYPEARRTDNLFEAIERQESIVKGSGQFFIQRVFPLTAGWYQSTQAPKMYGMLGETIVRVPAEKQGLFSAYYAKLLRESLSEDDSDLSKAISKKLNEWYNTNQTIDESKLYIWMAANGKRTSFKPPVEQAIVNGDGEIEKLTMSQKEKYEPKAALKSKEFLLKNLYKLQILREVGGETTEDKEKAFSTEIQKIFKQNFLNEYYLGEKSFGDKTAEMVAASVNNMQTKLDEKVNSAIIEYIKRTEKNKDIKITPEEEEMASKGYTAEQYLAFIKDEEDKMGKLERARLVGILTQEQFMKSLEMLGKFKSKSGLDDYLKNNKPF